MEPTNARLTFLSVPQQHHPTASHPRRHMPHMAPLPAVPAWPRRPACAVCSVKGGGCFKASEWGGALIEEMKPAAGDVVVEGK